MPWARRRPWWSGSRGCRKAFQAASRPRDQRMGCLRPSPAGPNQQPTEASLGCRRLWLDPWFCSHSLHKSLGVAMGAAPVPALTPALRPLLLSLESQALGPGPEDHSHPTEAQSQGTQGYRMGRWGRYIRRRTEGPVKAQAPVKAQWALPTNALYVSFRGLEEKGGSDSASSRQPFCAPWLPALSPCEDCG